MAILTTGAPANRRVLTFNFLSCLHQSCYFIGAAHAQDRIEGPVTATKMALLKQV